MVLVVDPAETFEMALALLLWFRSLWETLLDNHPQTREPLWKSSFLEEKLHLITGAKNNKSGHIRLSKKNGLTLLTALFPQGDGAQAKRDLLGPPCPGFSHRA